MSIIYQTAKLPVVYKARMWSAATIFHVICTIIKFGGPILTGVFYIINHSGSSLDTEFPFVTPGSIFYLNLIDVNGSSIIYPVNSNQPLTKSISVMMHPQYGSNNYLTSWKLNVRITANPDSQIKVSQIISVTAFFDFSVNFQRWATNSIRSFGSFSYNFVKGVNHVYCHGDLVLEQSGIIEFRGSFNETQLGSFDLDNYDSLADLIKARDNVSTLFYVDWGDTFCSFGSTNTFSLDLNIIVKDLTIYHSIPLISSIENFLIIYLASYLFFSFVLDNFQGFIFRNGIIKSWSIPLYQKAQKPKGTI